MGRKLPYLLVATSLIAGWNRPAPGQDICRPVAIQARLQAPARAAIAPRRTLLESRLAALLAERKTFNAKCNKVLEGSQEDAACALAYTEISSKIGGYKADCKAFNRDVAAALAAAASATGGAAPPRVARPFTARIDARGEVAILMPDGQRLAGDALLTARLLPGAKIVTGPTGRAQMMLPDETVFTVGPNANMIIDDFVYDPAAPTASMSASVISGTVRFITGKIAAKDPAKMKVWMKVGAIGPRGTDFECTAEKGSSSLKVFSGEVEFTPAKGGAAIRVRAGEMLTFDDDHRIVGPKPVT